MGDLLVGGRRSGPATGARTRRGRSGCAAIRENGPAAPRPPAPDRPAHGPRGRPPAPAPWRCPPAGPAAPLAETGGGGAGQPVRPGAGAAGRIAATDGGRGPAGVSTADPARPGRASRRPATAGPADRPPAPRPGCRRRRPAGSAGRAASGRRGGPARPAPTRLGLDGGRTRQHRRGRFPAERVEPSGDGRDRSPGLGHDPVRDPGLVARCAGRPGEPFAHAARMARPAPRSPPWPGRRARSGARASSGCSASRARANCARVERGARDGEARFRRPAREPGQRLGAAQPVDRGIAGAQVEVGGREVRMLDRPARPSRRTLAARRRSPLRASCRPASAAAGTRSGASRTASRRRRRARHRDRAPPWRSRPRRGARRAGGARSPGRRGPARCAARRCDRALPVALGRMRLEHGVVRPADGGRDAGRLLGIARGPRRIVARRCASTNSPRRPSTRVSGSSVMRPEGRFGRPRDCRPPARPAPSGEAPAAGGRAAAPPRPRSGAPPRRRPRRPPRCRATGPSGLRSRLRSRDAPADAAGRVRIEPDDRPRTRATASIARTTIPTTPTASEVVYCAARPGDGDRLGMVGEPDRARSPRCRSRAR